MRLPEVAAYMRTPYLFLTPDRSGADLGSLNLFASADVAGYRTIDRPLMVAGRFPDPSRPFDVAINPTAATRLHLRVGSRLTLHALSAAQVRDCGRLISDPAGFAPRAPR